MLEEDFVNCGRGSFQHWDVLQHLRKTVNRIVHMGRIVLRKYLYDVQQERGQDHRHVMDFISRGRDYVVCVYTKNRMCIRILAQDIIGHIVVSSVSFGSTKLYNGL